MLSDIIDYIETHGTTIAFHPNHRNGFGYVLHKSTMLRAKVGFLILQPLGFSRAAK